MGQPAFKYFCHSVELDKVEGQSPLTIACRCWPAIPRWRRAPAVCWSACGWLVAFQRNGVEGRGGWAAPPTSFDRFRSILDNGSSAVRGAMANRRLWLWHGVSGITLSGRISNGSVFQSMSSSSTIGSSSWHLSMRVDSSIGVRSANVSAWGQRRRCYGTWERSGLRIVNEKKCCHTLYHMWHRAVHRRYSLSLAMVSLASPIGSGRV